MKKLIRLFESATQRRDRLTRQLAALLDRQTIEVAKVKDILREGADPNLYVPSSTGKRYTALHRAAIGKNASLDAVNALLDAGANPFQPIVFARREWRLSDMAENSIIAARLKTAEAEFVLAHGPQSPLARPSCSVKRRSA